MSLRDRIKVQRILLSGITALIEKLQFLLSDISAQNGIAVREAAEAPHDVAMAFGIHGVRRPQMTAQCHRPVLIGQIFRVGEG